MYSTVIASMLSGIRAVPVRVEVDISAGMPGFEMVGYLSSEVREARERVRTALHNCKIALPAKRITVNLSPANIRKSGTGFDVAIAVALLAAMELVEPKAVADTVFVGELNLRGDILPVSGVLPIVSDMAACGIRRFLVPADNVGEAQLVRDVTVIGCSDLGGLLNGLRGQAYEKPPKTAEQEAGTCERTVDFSEVNGQSYLRRAAEVAAAGMHNMLMVGPPGAGKTMIAERMATILPRLTEQERLELSKIYSVKGMLGRQNHLLSRRPFRSPHHTISLVGLAGGGPMLVPGEISLAHKGVLFLGGYFCKTAETPNLRALWRFSYLEFFKKSAKTILHTTFWNCVLPLFGFSFAKMFMGVYTLMAKLYTIWQKKITKWRNYTRMAKGERAYGI